MSRIFNCGAKTKGRKSRQKVESGRVLGEGVRSQLTTCCGARVSVGALWAPPAGLGTDPRPPKGFPLFSALRMASPDTIILLIVDYHAAFPGPRTTCPPPCVRTCHFSSWTFNSPSLFILMNYASFWDRPKLSMSFLTQSHQVFFGRPLCLIPSTSHVTQRLTQSSFFVLHVQTISTYWNQICFLLELYTQHTSMCYC